MDFSLCLLHILIFHNEKRVEAENMTSKFRCHHVPSYRKKKKINDNDGCSQHTYKGLQYAKQGLVNLTYSNPFNPHNNSTGCYYYTHFTEEELEAGILM